MSIKACGVLSKSKFLRTIISFLSLSTIRCGLNKSRRKRVEVALPRSLNKSAAGRTSFPSPVLVSLVSLLLRSSIIPVHIRVCAEERRLAKEYIFERGYIQEDR